MDDGTVSLIHSTVKLIGLITIHSISSISQILLFNCRYFNAAFDKLSMSARPTALLLQSVLQNA